jgi:hypothetical protein
LNQAGDREDCFNLETKLSPGAFQTARLNSGMVALESALRAQTFDL